MKPVFIVCFLLVNFQVLATNFEPIGTGSKASANTFLNHADVWTSMNHAASMPLFGKTGFAVQAERKYNIKNFQSLALAYVQAFKNDNYLGISVFRFGDELYNFSRFNLSYSKQIGLFSIGIGTELLQWHIEETQNTFKPVINLSGQARVIKDKLFIGAQAINLLQQELSSYQNEVVPSVMCAGMLYKHNTQINILAEFQIQTYQNTVPKLAIEYSPIEKLTFRIGVSNTNPIYHAGLGLNLKHWQIGYSYISHPQLNSSQCISLALYPNFKPKNTNVK